MEAGALGSSTWISAPDRTHLARAIKRYVHDSAESRYEASTPFQPLCEPLCEVGAVSRTRPPRTAHPASRPASRSGKTGEFSGGRNHAVAWNYRRERVFGQGLSDGSRRARLFDFRGNPTVGADLASRNFGAGFPDGLVKRRVVLHFFENGWRYFFHNGGWIIFPRIRGPLAPVASGQLLGRRRKAR